MKIKDKLYWYLIKWNLFQYKVLDNMRKKLDELVWKIEKKL